MTRHLLTVPGWVLLAAGLLLYLGAIARGVLRVTRQYSRAMSGSSWLRLNAALAAAGKRWYFLLVALIGLVLVALGR